MNAIARFVQYLPKSLEGRIGLDPAKSITVRFEQFFECVSVGAVDTRLRSTEAAERFAVEVGANAQPEIALAGPAGENYLAKSRYFVPMGGPSAVASEPRQTVLSG
jgi:hypothetical protein